MKNKNTTCFKPRESLMGKINTEWLQRGRGAGSAPVGEREAVGQGTHSSSAWFKNNSAGFSELQFSLPSVKISHVKKKEKKKRAPEKQTSFSWFLLIRFTGT